jgi:hypothetical protein
MLRGKERGNISTEEWLGQDLSTVTDSTISLSVILHRPPSCSDYVLKHQQIIFSNIWRGYNLKMRIKHENGPEDILKNVEVYKI